jgi:PadR family transcriptional regulator PadR
VKSYWTQAENGRDRKYYSITAKGKKKLRVAVKEWKLYSEAVDSLLKGLRLIQS